MSPGKRKTKGDLCPLSLKDISTIEILPEILEAGVTSLKIEGRMKQPGYTAGVTKVYRKYLDLLFEKGPDSYKVEERDRQYLLDLFNRGGSCTGYYQMQNGPDMMAFTNEKKTGNVTCSPVQKKEKIRGSLDPLSRKRCHPGCILWGCPWDSYPGRGTVCTESASYQRTCGDTDGETGKYSL